MNNSYQWRIQGRGPGGPGPPPLFLDQTLAPRAEKSFFGGDRSPLSEGLDLPLHTYNKFTLNLDLIQRATIFIINLHGSIINSLLYIVQAD